MVDIMTQNTGLNQSIVDPGYFYHPKKGTIISTHVDDMPGFGPTDKALDKLEKDIEKRVELDKMGLPTKLLGMELSWNNESVKLSQKQSIEKLAKEHKTQVTIPRRTFPLNLENYAKGQELEKLAPQELKNYQSLVGSLLYINRCTRPEISIHENLLGRHTSDATPNNWKAAMHVLRNLTLSKQDSVVLTKRNENHEVIKAYADASYGGEETKSQNGNLLTMNNNLIMWASRK